MTHFEIKLAAGQDFPETLTFRIPSPSQLVVAANQLNKFDLPPRRNRKAADRLIAQQLVAPKLSQKVLSKLPIATREALMQTLWCRGLHAEITKADEAITCAWLERDLKEFRLEAILREDLEMLGEQNDGKLHGYYFQAPYEPEQLSKVLTAYSLSSVSLRSLPEYWLARNSTYPLPWSALQKAIGDSFNHRLNDLLNHPGACAVRLVILVEGTTETILLPEFARLEGLPFEHVRLIPAGGKNQVAGLYQTLASELAVPIFVLLDQDADQAASVLSDTCRPGDQVIQISEGEFEDWYEPTLIVHTVNQTYQPHPRLTLQSYDAIRRLEDPRIQSLTGVLPPKNRVEELRLIWQVLQLGGFDKVDFAEKIADSITPVVTCSPGLKAFLKRVSYALSDSQAAS